MVIGKEITDKTSVPQIQVVIPVSVLTVRTKNTSTNVLQVRTATQASAHIITWTVRGIILQTEREGIITS